MPSGLVKVSFFGGIGFGCVNDPLQTRDGALLVASLDDLMATKLKATLDRAEAKDYRDIAEMISAGVSLPAGLSAFKQMFNGEPAQVLRIAKCCCIIRTFITSCGACCLLCCSLG